MTYGKTEDEALEEAEAAIRRLADPDHSSKIEKVEAALAALGRRLIVQAA